MTHQCIAHHRFCWLPHFEGGRIQTNEGQVRDRGHCLLHRITPITSVFCSCYTIYSLWSCSTYLIFFATNVRIPELCIVSIPYHPIPSHPLAVTTPPRHRITDESQDLYSAQLTPGALLHIAFDAAQETGAAAASGKKGGTASAAARAGGGAGAAAAASQKEGVCLGSKT